MAVGFKKLTICARTAAEHQELSTSLDKECSSNDGEQFHRLTNRLLQQSTRGLQSAAIRQVATRPELRRSIESYMVADAAITLLLCRVTTCIGSASESE